MNQNRSARGHGRFIRVKGMGYSEEQAVYRALITEGIGELMIPTCFLELVFFTSDLTPLGCIIKPLNTKKQLGKTFP